MGGGSYFMLPLNKPSYGNIFEFWVAHLHREPTDH